MRTLSPRFLPGAAPWLWPLSLFVVFGTASGITVNLNFVQVAMLPGTAPTPFPCGDPRHNGKICIFGSTHFLEEGESLVIFEHEGNNVFNRITYPRMGGLLEFGYSDGDSLGEVVTSVGSWYVRIYRSATRDSFPTTCIFNESINDGHVVLAHFTDLDRDGQQEMAYTKGEYGIWLFENTHGTVFESTAVLADDPPYGYYLHFAVGDFDRDGLMELVCGRADAQDSGALYIYEALGPNNQYVLSAVCSTASFENSGIAAAHDMDHNSRDEFVVWGRGRGSGSTDSGRLAVYEAPEHARYKAVWEQRLPWNWFPGDYTVSVGDVDGDGTDDFAITTGFDVEVFKCTGPETYQRMGSIPIPAFNVKLFDVNGDDRAEIVLDEGLFSDTALVFEDTEALALDEFARLPKPQAPTLPTTIVRAGASVSFPSLDRGAEIAVYDIRGRAIIRRKATETGDWRWNMTDATGKTVSAGTYFVTIRSRNRTIQSKLCVIR